MSIGKNGVVVMMCMMIGVMAGCKKEDSGSSNEVVTRGAAVNSAAVSVPSSTGEKVKEVETKAEVIEAKELIARAEIEFNRVGAYSSVRPPAWRIAQVNKYVCEKLMGYQLKREVIEAMVEEVKGLESGIRKDILTHFVNHLANINGFRVFNR